MSAAQTKTVGGFSFREQGGTSRKRQLADTVAAPAKRRITSSFASSHDDVQAEDRIANSVFNVEDFHSVALSAYSATQTLQAAERMLAVFEAVATAANQTIPLGESSTANIGEGTFQLNNAARESSSVSQLSRSSQMP
jgi:hypothetical protein